MLYQMVTERVNKILTRKGWAIPPAILVIGSIVWDAWLLLGHASTASWLAKVLPSNLQVPHWSATFWPPLSMFLAGLLWLGFLAFWPKRVAGIVGTADLMLQELDLADIEIVDGGAGYRINLAAFVRIEVAATDKPRTVKHFEIELLAPDGTQYNAQSEYELGHYSHVHDVTTRDNWGMANVNRVREPMEDLAARLRTPILPDTHVARAWVRFEIPNLRQGHEPRNCQIRIHAVDPRDERHEIVTDGLQVRAIDDREYAVVEPH